MWALAPLLFPWAWGEAAARAIAEGGAFAWCCRGGSCGFGETGLVLLQTGVEGRLNFICFSSGYGFFLFDDLGERAFDIELFFAAKREGGELAGGGEAVNDIANARARGERREEDFGLLRGGGDGGLQVERDQDGERGGLRLRAADIQLAAVARAEQFPVRRRAVFIGHGHDTHRVPELAERAERSGFRDFAAEAPAQLNGGECAFASEDVEGLDGQRRDTRRTAGGRRALGIALRLQGVEIRQSFRSDEEIGLLAGDAGSRAEEIQGNGCTGGDEAREHLRSGGDLRGRGSGIGAARDGFHEAGRGDRQVLPPWKVEAERRVGEPALGVVEGEKRVAVLTPACLPRFVELILIHEFRS